MKNLRIVLWLCALCASLAFAPITLAQVPTPYHPGDKLSFKVSFDGPDSGKIQGINLYLDLISERHPDQSSLGTEIQVTQTAQLGHGDFSVSVNLPAYLASGTYKLRTMLANVGDGSFRYQGMELPNITVSFENPEHLEKPTIRGITETSKP